MKISVVVPTFNREKFITKTLISIYNQTIKPDEIIVVDDGSTDDTKSILKNLDFPIKYIYQQNQGVSCARNQGITKAKHNWIAFCDSDDLWEKDKLEKQILFHKQNPTILFSHTDELWKFNNKIIKQKKHQQKPKGWCFIDNLDICKIGASTVLIHKQIFDDIGLFDEQLIACEDYDLWLRILTKYELGFIDEKLIIKIAGHNNQLSFTTKFMDKYRIIALKKHLNSSYKQYISKELSHKKDILLKGAIKHHNQQIIQWCENIV